MPNNLDLFSRWLERAGGDDEQRRIDVARERRQLELIEAYREALAVSIAVMGMNGYGFPQHAIDWAGDVVLPMPSRPGQSSLDAILRAIELDREVRRG